MTGTSKSAGFIRMALMATAFVVLTIVLLVFQPGSPRHAQNTLEAETSTSVTRVADPLALTEPEIPATVAVPVQPPARPDPVVVAQTPVQPVPGPSPDIGTTTNMRDMTFSAISNLKSVTTGEAPAPGEPGSLLHSVVQRSLANQPGTTAAAPQLTQIEPVRTTTSRFPATASYFVRPGDTLLSIAKEIYGDTEKATGIYRANADIMTSPDSLKPGMVLKLPTP